MSQFAEKVQCTRTSKKTPFKQIPVEEWRMEILNDVMSKAYKGETVDPYLFSSAKDKLRTMKLGMRYVVTNPKLSLIDELGHGFGRFLLVLRGRGIVILAAEKE
ncbi:expressed unknown protein [Seminavis robusta]|uniref:Uncharacterized protein n=1 Tax=Seminavis robusta TaxID=568900 RepID=A0A9N8F4R2_9STRA|nr:expressed unknown protein [Seminavis robusta]|eukprot:Sro4154_g353200.1 n/a (104) ;mRNA; f:2281-2592